MHPLQNQHQLFGSDQLEHSNGNEGARIQRKILCVMMLLSFHANATLLMQGGFYKAVHVHSCSITYKRKASNFQYVSPSTGDWIERDEKEYKDFVCNIYAN